MAKRRDSIAGGRSGLNGLTELRLRNQLERTYQNCFGAENGLRLLVQLATAQMLSGGASRTAIRQALTRVVLDHPAGDVRVKALTAMILQWSASTPAAIVKEA